jgi:hypothetical protein
MWLMPVILATQEAEIQRIIVQCQPRQKVYKTPSQPIPGHSTVHLSSQLHQGGLWSQASPSNISMEKTRCVVHTYHPSYGRKYKIGGSQFRIAQAKSKTQSPE